VDTRKKKRNEPIAEVTTNAILASTAVLARVCGQALVDFDFAARACNWNRRMKASKQKNKGRKREIEPE
jgi:hypothetical protein